MKRTVKAWVLLGGHCRGVRAIYRFRNNAHPAVWNMMAPATVVWDDGMPAKRRRPR